MSDHTSGTRAPVILVAWIALLFAPAALHRLIALPTLVSLDRTWPQTLHAYATPHETAVAEALSLLGSPSTLTMAVPLAAITLWTSHRKRQASILAAAMAGAALFENLIKLHYRRPRPAVAWASVREPTFSFPSGHAVLNIVLYGMILYLLWPGIERTWQRLALPAACVALVAAIGLSRIYLGAHYPTDVAAGFVLGAVWLFTVIATDRSFQS